MVSTVPRIAADNLARVSGLSGSPASTLLISPAALLSSPSVADWVLESRRNVAKVTHLVGSNVCVLATQLSPTLCSHMDCSPPGSSVHGILQARTLEWVSIPFSSRQQSWNQSHMHLSLHRSSTSSHASTTTSLHPSYLSSHGCGIRHNFGSGGILITGPFTATILIRQVDSSNELRSAIKNESRGHFPGGPVVKTPCSQHSKSGFRLWLEN